MSLKAVSSSENDTMAGAAKLNASDLTKWRKYSVLMIDKQSSSYTRQVITKYC